MTTIAIEGMKFHAFHGCLPEEQVTGNTFIVDLYIKTDTTKAEQSDDLNDALDYVSCYNVVKQEMEIPSKLLEHVGRRILTALKDTFEEVEFVEVKVSKINPPINGQAESVSAFLTA